MNTETKVKGYKVTNGDMTCLGFQYEVGKKFVHYGDILLCDYGFHFCLTVNNCFTYYDFTPTNKVFEIEASGTIKHGDDKSVCSEITLVRELTWAEVLEVANLGANNTGHSNSGNRNSGNRNSGNRNSGDSNSGYSNSGNSNSGNRNSGNRNSGNWNSGDSNSGYSNSGNSNSGYSNSGNWNSGDRNSGDSNSGYRNSGAFCTNNNPTLILFNKPTDILVRDWENHEAVRIMGNLEPTIWIPAGMMNDEEKAKHPKYETTEGYLKTIPIKEAWSNMWHNLSDKKKSVFTSLPNFDAVVFLEITGIDVYK